MSYVTDSFDERVIEMLKKGGMGLLPSDTIYGLSCRALDQAAVERIHKLKERDENKPFIVLISNFKMLNFLAITEDIEKIAGNYWPGEVSFIVSAPKARDFLTRGTSSLAIRMPNYPELLSLIEQVGPIVSTSANLQGEEPVKSVEQAQQIFGDQLDFYVNAGELNNPPSTLVILKDGKINVIRQGAIKIEEAE